MSKRRAAAPTPTAFPGSVHSFTYKYSIVKLHYNYKYEFLRPKTEEVVKRYKEKWREESQLKSRSPFAPPPQPPQPPLTPPMPSQRALRARRLCQHPPHPQHPQLPTLTPPEHNLLCA